MCSEEYSLLCQTAVYTFSFNLKIIYNFNKRTLASAIVTLRAPLIQFNMGLNDVVALSVLISDK